MSETTTRFALYATAAVVVAIASLALAGGTVAADGSVENTADDPSADDPVRGIIGCADVSVEDDGTIRVEYGQTFVEINPVTGERRGATGGCAVS